MNASFYNGLSGIRSQQFGLDIQADNIANISTIGFKGSSPEFSTSFATTLSDAYFDSTSNDVGLGSRPGGTVLTMEQGIFQFTDNVFDLAIKGEGWFGVTGKDSQNYFTRAGAFSVDSQGNMVDPNGNYLLGTLGGNITTTSLPQETLEKFGTYYGVNSSQLGTPYAVSDLSDIALGSADGQERINLPNILYYPPVPTTNVSYQANLDPEVNISSTNVDLDSADITIDNLDLINEAINISGTITNTPEILNPREGDSVLITFTDIAGITVSASAVLDSSLNWVMPTKDISSLDTTNPITTTAALQTLQEIPNVEHFSSTVISPSGEQDILDMTYTKRVPQPSIGSVWDGVLQVLSFYEKYDPNTTYDPLVYKVDQNAEKVYEIVDSQVGTIEFSGSGELSSSTIPTMSNGGTPLNINLGEPNSFDGLISNVNLDKAKSEQHDGFLSGMLKAYGMDGQGNIVAEFDNGKSVAMAKVALYHFQNDQGLTKTTSTLFSVSANSGDPIFYTDANGNTTLGSQIFANRLEGSNVSMATALTELIIMQKAFDSSAKSITTSDEMIQNAINMKR